MFSRSLTTFCTCMGMYGFSRGYRSEQFDGRHKMITRHKLTTDRITTSVLNGMLYSVPIFNLYYVSKLLNRLEIEHRNLDPKEFPSEYREIDGECKSTF